MIIMCTNESTGKSLQYSPPVTTMAPSMEPSVSPSQASPLGASAAPATAHSPQPQMSFPLDHYRLQLYNYAMVERLRCGQYPGTLPIRPTYPPYSPHLALQMSLFHNRMFQPEEPKPQHSYIGLIAMAILGSPEQKLVLSDIYQHILDNYPYFRTRGPGWRNSIRHNLSLNDCFVKAGRSANGKGHYWAIHEANVDDFRKGDFRRRKAQRKVRKHMGLAVDDDGTDSPSPPPLSLTPPPLTAFGHHWGHHLSPAVAVYSQVSKKRQFDVASLLAPDDRDLKAPPAKRFHAAVAAGSDLDEDIDVVASDQEEKDESLTRGSAAEPLLDSPERSFQPTAWHGLMGQWSGGFHPLGAAMDPRILGRYYGQYVAAAQASRRFNGATLVAGNNNNNNDLTELSPTAASVQAAVQSNDC